uniref:ShKT domain-containing protein n=1 Tax=Parastrongyloides trichosuri TaxID=131310 RepID=A0A0N4ZVT7_PARTI
MKSVIISFAIFSFMISSTFAATCSVMASSGYCVNSVYRSVMCSSCSTECNTVGGDAACTVATASTSCTDEATNCASLKYLCTNATYKTLLSQRCQATCNTCGGSAATTTTTGAATTTTTSSSATTTVDSSATTTTTESTTTTTTV